MDDGDDDDDEGDGGGDLHWLVVPISIYTIFAWESLGHVAA